MMEDKRTRYHICSSDVEKPTNVCSLYVGGCARNNFSKSASKLSESYNFLITMQDFCNMYTVLYYEDCFQV